MEKGTIGSRIREQRERLGYSQEQLAEKTGITTRSQRNYEKGTRVPDAEYLAAISPLGVDINYVINGENAYRTHNEISSVTYVTAIEMAFGISSECLDEIVDKALVDDNVSGFDPSVFFNEMARESEVFRLMADRYAALDASILTLTIEGIEVAAAKAGLAITASKKAGATVMLYRAFKANGRIDQAMIDDAVKLAAS